MKKWIMPTILILTLLYSACSEKQEVLAKIGWWEKIRQADMDEEGSLFEDDRDKSQVFYDLLKRNVLYRAALRAKYDQDPEALAEIAKTRKRTIVSHFRSEIIQKNYGFAEKRIKRFYLKNKKLFAKTPKPTPENIEDFDSLSDSAQALALDPIVPYEEAHESVVDTLILRQDAVDLKKTYDEKKDLYKVRAHANLAHILSRNRKDVQTALDSIVGGMTFEQAVLKFSQDWLTTHKEGRLGIIWEKDTLPNGMGVMPALDSALFADPPQIDTIGSVFLTKILKSNRGFHLFKVMELLPARVREFEEVVPELREAALKDWKNNIEDRTFKRLMKKHKFVIVDTTQPPEEEEIQDYYERAYRKRMGDTAKPLAEMREKITSILSESRPEMFPPDFAFARGTRKFMVTAGEIQEYLENIPNPFRKRYKNRDGRIFLVKQLVFDELMLREAKAMGIHRLQSVKRDIRKKIRSYYSGRFQDDFLDRDLGYSEEALQAHYEKHRAYFDTLGQDGRPFEMLREEVADHLNQDPKDMERFFLLHAEDFAGNDSIIPVLDSVRDTVVSVYAYYMRQKRKEKVYLDIEKQMGVRIVKKDFQRDASQSDSVLYQKAQDIISTGENLSKAKETLAKVRWDFPSTELGDDICFSLGQIHNTMKEHKEAVREYRKLLRLFPESDYNYKALFMVGFTYSEYLQDFDKARVAFEKVISDFPKCELADDAEFMIKYLGKDLSEIEFLNPDNEEPSS